MEELEIDYSLDISQESKNKINEIVHKIKYAEEKYKQEKRDVSLNREKEVKELQKVLVSISKINEWDIAGISDIEIEQLQDNLAIFEKTKKMIEDIITIKKEDNQNISTSRIDGLIFKVRRIGLEKVKEILKNERISDYTKLAHDTFTRNGLEVREKTKLKEGSSRYLSLEDAKKIE